MNECVAEIRALKPYFSKLGANFSRKRYVTDVISDVGSNPSKSRTLKLGLDILRTFKLDLFSSEPCYKLNSSNL